MFNKKKKKEKEKIKLKDRPAIKWIKENAPNLLGQGFEIIGEVAGVEILENFGEMIQNKPEEQFNSEFEKDYILNMIKADIEAEIQAQKEVTNRWGLDMNSDSWLSKNIRPMVCAYTWVLLTVCFILKWCGYELPEYYIALFTSLALAVNGAYFTARTIEKRNKNKYLEK